MMIEQIARRKSLFFMLLSRCRKLKFVFRASHKSGIRFEKSDNCAIRRLNGSIKTKNATKKEERTMRSFVPLQASVTILKNSDSLSDENE